MPRKTTKNAAPSPAIASDRAWEAREALRTLTRADEIRSDRTLMREVKAEAKKQIKTVGKVLGGSTRKK